MIESLYMFAIVPPAGLGKEIDDLRHEFSENFQCYRALKPPVHVTLFPPFKATADIEQKILPLQKWAGQQLPFILNLHNFSFFENRKNPVLFIDVVKSEQLKNLHSGFLRQIKNYLPPAIEIDKSQYHPHFTIGYRDITPEIMPNASPKTEETLLVVNKLKVWFEAERNWLGKTTKYYKAVDDVSFELKKGEVLGLVGESGCGKSTLSKSLIGLLPVNEGQIIYNSEDLAKLPYKEWTRIRREIQMIFQDPYGSLNPRMNIGDMLMEPMRAHHIVPRAELRKEAQRLLDLVQLPSDSMKRYPHQFSGGQRQRLGIARALALRPQLLVCDESVSALDVSVQAQILNLLKDLQQEFQLTYLFISHDLNVVHYISDRVMVMQAGHIVESGEAEQVLRQPVNDYTKRLIEAMPKM